jgi:hypothetical protein
MTAQDRDGEGWGSLLQLLYRYVWPMWMFRDANRGSAVERAAAYRHNRSVRRHLPGYAGKWLLIAGATLLAMRAAEQPPSVDAGCQLACALLAVWLAWAVIVVIVLIAAWLYMESVPA